MKNLKQLLLTGITMLLCSTIYAQAPQKFNYQAVARNNNNIIANGNVGVRLTITQGNGGTSLYQETQTPTTNDFGIFSLQVGGGTVVSGDFTTIDWKIGDKWLQVEMDPTGGTTYIDMGSSELASVPFALHTAGAWTATGSDITNPNAGAVNIQNGNLALNFNEIRLAESVNTNHILKYDADVDGPRMSGYAGGVLGGTNPDTSVLRWVWDGFNCKVGIGTSAPEAMFHVKGPGWYAGNHMALFENTDGANADGIAIKINNATTDKENNFVTFLNQNGDVKGRIEGFNLATDLWTPPSIPIPDVTLNYTWSAGTFPTLNSGTWPTINPGSWPTINPGTWPTVTVDPPNTPGSLTFTSTDLDGNGPLPSFQRVTGVDVNVGSFNAGVSGGSWGNLSGGSWGSLTGGSWGSLTGGSLPSLSFGNPPFNIGLPTQNDAQTLACEAMERGLDGLIALDVFTAATNALKATVVQACKDGGVTYGSHGADYAEYIEKADHSEYIQAFDVVGIKGGKVSRNTEGAEQIMIVSSKPVVLGNTPNEGEEKNYVTCGFMGQLPCVVRGLCHKGDYVLASNLNDGTAVAVAPENLTIDMLDRIVGRAWEEQTSEIYGLVNVAIGLKTNEWVSIFKTQENKMSTMSADIDMLKSAMGIKNVNAGANSSASISK